MVAHLVSKIHRLLCNKKAHYCGHKSPSQNQTNPVYILPILSSHLHLGLPHGTLISKYPTGMLYAFLNFTMSATCGVHLILLHLIAVVILCETYKLWNLSSGNFLEHSLTLSLSLSLSDDLQLVSSVVYFQVPLIRYPFYFTGICVRI
jgi:hypothetical protein